MSDTLAKAKTNMEIWDQSDKPPKDALKQIGGGRMKGMTNINPQWRYKKLTELFGPCGVGWHIEETGREFVPCGDEIAVFIDIKLHIAGFASTIEGSGGSMFRTAESAGLRCNDEAVKMATTDAVSCACKKLGIGSAIYEGAWDGCKYREDAPDPQPQKTTKKTKPQIDFLKSCGEAKTLIGEKGYYEVLGQCGFAKSSEVGNKEDRANVLTALRAYYEMNKEDK